MPKSTTNLATTLGTSFNQLAEEVRQHFENALTREIRDQVHPAIRQRYQALGFNMVAVDAYLLSETYWSTPISLMSPHSLGSTATYTRWTDWKQVSQLCTHLGLPVPEDWTEDLRAFLTTIAAAKEEASNLFFRFAPRIEIPPETRLIQRSDIPSLLYHIPNLSMLFMNPEPCARRPRWTIPPESVANLNQILIRAIAAGIRPNTTC
jgi:hypothetical protein